MTTANTHRSRQPIALIGYRGCGKSAVGRELAVLLGGDHIDTDEAIAEQAGRSIAAIFKDEGEAGFRRRERQTVAQAVIKAPAVISVGGGAVLDPDSVQTLKTQATLVYLKASAEVLWQRIAVDPATDGTRPALTDRAGLDEVRHLLAERSPHYERAADLTIDAEQGGPREIAAEIADRLGRAVDPWGSASG